MKHVMILSILASLLLISGCNSLPKLPDFLKSDSNDSPQLNEEASEEPNVSQQLQAQAQEIEMLRAELQELKPDVNRVLEMEGDVQLFLEKIAKTSDLSSQAFIGRVPSRDFEPNTEPTFDGGTTGPSFTNPENEVEVGSAQPPANFGDGVSSSDSKIDNKFNYSNQTPREESNSADASIDNKFSSSNGSPVIAQQPDGDATFAIHLVSTTTTAQLLKAWQEVSVKYGLSQKTPLVTDVNVSNKVFKSLRIGPYRQDEARQTCQMIKQRGEYCSIMNYVGEQLL